MSESTNINETNNVSNTLHEALKDLCQNNADFFQNDYSENGQRLHAAFLGMIDHINNMWPTLIEIREVAHHYDFDENTPGNGFRSFSVVVDSSINFSINVCKRVCIKRDNMLFRKSVATKEVEACSHLLASMGTCLKLLKVILSWIPPEEKSLFPCISHTPEELFAQTENINQYCFYGRCLGFQFCESLRNFLKFVSLSMAIFSEAYYSEGSFISKATSSVVTSGKYVVDPELRARRIVNISQNADVQFCKAFWCLSEMDMMHRVPKFVSANVGISKVIKLPPEPFSIPNEEGTEIDIPVPSAHIGQQPVQVRLISYFVRKGMVGEANNTNALPPSRGLLVHCHGGGFVAQSSKSHESYLRHWAKTLDVPILSIDYSLAPEAPFPRALEEVFYAYCWAKKNCHLLGSTGERIVVAGDSAGANLLLGMTLKCLDHDVPTPDGIFSAYVPTSCTFAPSPARMLCMMDPLLPFGFMMRCLKAYTMQPGVEHAQNGHAAANGIYKPTDGANSSSDTESFEEVSESDLHELEAHKSPVSVTSDTLTDMSLNSQLTENKDDTTVKEVSILEIPSDSDQMKNNEYVNDFLEKYVLDSDTDSDATKIPILKSETLDSNLDSGFQNKIAGFVASLRGKIRSLVGQSAPSGAALFLDADTERSVLEEFRFVVPKDPFMSPYFAENSILAKFPPTKIMTVQLDPCLDDCVMFAKKLKKLDVNVTLDILEGLPHGFLNFSLFSKEAHDGCKLCVQRISELLDLKSLPSPIE